MPLKTIIVLAKSKKMGAWCIAGREVQFDAAANRIVNVLGWIRPVSADVQTHGAISNEQCALQNGHTVKVYDIVEIDFQHHQHDLYQPENWLISDRPWRKLTAISATDITSTVLAEAPASIWLEAGHETDYITNQYHLAHALGQSLYLIAVTNFQVHLTYELNPFVGRYKRETRASFSYNGTHYSGISITDPAIRRIFSNQYPGEGGVEVVKPLLVRDNIRLCVSLGPAFGPNARHFKFIAAIFDFTGNIQGRFG